MWRVIIFDIFLLLCLLTAAFLLFKTLYKSPVVKKLASEEQGNLSERVEEVVEEVQERKAVLTAAQRAIQEESERLQEFFPENREKQR